MDTDVYGLKYTEEQRLHDERNQLALSLPPRRTALESQSELVSVPKCVTCTGDITATSQNPSQPEPPPTGNGNSTLHTRPFFWDSNLAFGYVDCPDQISMTLNFLLERIPNALDARESHHLLDDGDHPSFGFRLEHDGPRTLREYLEAP